MVHTTLDIRLLRLTLGHNVTLDPVVTASNATKHQMITIMYTTAFTAASAMFANEMGENRKPKCSQPPSARTFSGTLVVQNQIPMAATVTSTTKYRNL